MILCSPSPGALASDKITCETFTLGKQFMLPQKEKTISVDHILNAGSDL